MKVLSKSVRCRSVVSNYVLTENVSRWSFASKSCQHKLSGITDLAQTGEEWANFLLLACCSQERTGAYEVNRPPGNTTASPISRPRIVRSLTVAARFGEPKHP